MPELYGSDAYSPGEVAERVEQVGAVKARMHAGQLFTLSVLAGGFIGMGGLFMTVVSGDTAAGPDRIVAGLAFSLGLVLVVVAGAELFTGNVLLVIAWASRRIGGLELGRSWTIALAGNAVGAIGLAALVVLARVGDLEGGAVGARAIWLADYKAGLSFQVAFFRGVLCNVLVCLAIWGAMAGRSVTDKVLAVVPPITAFVAAGLEHSVANLFLIPLGVLTAQAGAAALGPGGEIVAPAWAGVIRNLVPVTLGNIVGGAGMVALVYHLVYRRRWPGPAGPSGGSRALDKRPTGG